ncbi:MAG: hypothetical protein V2A79_02160 [Planctomycetota bacterium]
MRLRAAECYYAIDGQRITIALADENISLIGEYGKKSLVTSIVLDGLPAHRSRDYRLDRNSLRGRFRHGPESVRFASLGGILALWREGDDRLRGRLRAFAKQQQFQVWLGWAGNRRVLLVGDFVAVRNPTRAEELRWRSEADGLERTAQPSDYGQPRPVTGPPVEPQETSPPDRPSGGEASPDRN